MTSLFSDLKIAIRHLMKSPGFVLTAVLMLALGIGATTAIFSIVEGVLLRPLPFPEPDRLVMVADILEGVAALRVWVDTRVRVMSCPAWAILRWSMRPA